MISLSSPGTYIYDFEVFMYDWLVVFKDINTLEEYRFHNNVEELKAFLPRVKYMIGFNNYYYDDIILTALVSMGYTPPLLYNLSTNLVSGSKAPNNIKQISSELPSLDCIQELGLGIGLKAIECNLGVSIKESSIPWDIKRPLSDKEIEDTFAYCSYDVNNTLTVFNLRSDYFQAKIDIVNEFNLPELFIKKTRAVLAGEVLQAKSSNLPVIYLKDRLLIDYVPTLRYDNIPKDIKVFYDDIIDRYKQGEYYKDLEEQSFVTKVNGVDHKYGFGGVHAGLEEFSYKGNIIYLDVSSYYPSLMIEYGFLSRACGSPELYKHLYDTRFKLKKSKSEKEYIYKILLNASFGATKFKHSKMFDPLQANNICVNGQLILTDLIVSLNPYAKLIQSNTDGIMLSYEDKDYNDIIRVKEEWEANYNLKLGQKILKEIYQKDMNNYIYVTDDNKISGKGRIKNWNIAKTNFESNSLSVIDIAFKRYYIDNIPIKDTIDELIANKQFAPFQLVVKKSSKYDGLAIFNAISNEYIKLDQKVNRVFASKSKNIGMIYKIKESKYSKYANTPDNIYLHNGDISKLNGNIIDKQWYIDLCKKHLLNGNIKKKKINLTNFIQLGLFEL